MEPLSILQSVAGFVQAQRVSAADRPAKIATIDPTFDILAGELPKVTFDGESTLSGKRYPYLGGYVPEAGDTVLMLPVGTTYVIVASISNTGQVGFAADATNSLYTTYFGPDSYVVVDSGTSELVLDGVSVGLGVVGGRRYTGATNRASGITTTEAVANVSSGTVDFVLGRMYLIRARFKLTGSVANDDWIVRLRRSTVSGTQLAEFVWKTPSLAYGYTFNLEALFIPTASGSDTFLLTGQRLAGTGSLTFSGGGTTNTLYVLVEDVGADTVISTTA